MSSLADVVDDNVWGADSLLFNSELKSIRWPDEDDECEVLTRGGISSSSSLVKSITGGDDISYDTFL